MRRGLVVVLVAMALTISGVMVVAAAVPQVQDALAALLPISGTGSGFATDGHEYVFRPPPPFRVAVPAYLPAGLSQRAETYVPARQPTVGQLPVGSSGGGSLDGGVPSATAAARQARDLDATVWLTTESGGNGAFRVRYYSPTEDRSVEIKELMAQPGESPPGDRVVVAGGAAAVQAAGNEATVTVVAYGTRVVIATNLGRAEAVKIAQQLRWQEPPPPTAPIPTVAPAAATATNAAIATRVSAQLPKADTAKIVAMIRPDGTVVLTAAAPLCPNHTVLDLNGVQFVWNDVVYVFKTNADGGYGIDTTVFGAKAPPPSVIEALRNALLQACHP